MSVATPPEAPEQALELFDRIYRFTVDQYRAIAEAGALGEATTGSNCWKG